MMINGNYSINTDEYLLISYGALKNIGFVLEVSHRLLDPENPTAPSPSPQKSTVGTCINAASLL